MNETVGARLDEFIKHLDVVILRRNFFTKKTQAFNKKKGFVKKAYYLKDYLNYDTFLQQKKALSIHDYRAF